MKTSMCLVVLLLVGSQAAVSSKPIYDFIRNVTMGVVTGFEGSKYTFPLSLCLNQTYTVALDDDLISVTMYASMQNWTAVDMYLAEAKYDFLAGVSGCDYMKVYDSAKHWYDNFDPTIDILRAWWNSILIWRNVNLAYGKCYADNLVGNTTGHWQAMGYYFGVSLQYLLPPLS